MIGEILWPLAFAYSAHTISAAIVKTFARPIPLAPDSNAVEVPDDLVAVSMQENEVWAQEEVLRAITERYEKLQDWNKVRFAMGIGRID
jgi:hypothetical protein